MSNEARELLAAARSGNIERVKYYVTNFGGSVCRDTILTTHETKLDLACLKLILRYCDDMNPPVQNSWRDGVVDSQVRMIRNWRFQDREVSQIRPVLLNYFFYEAVLRNNGNAIEELTESNNQNGKTTPDIPITAEAFAAYIGDRTFTSAQGIIASQGVDYLISSRRTNPVIGGQIKQVIDRNVIFAVSPEIFPKELQDFLKKPTRPLDVLFAELQSWIWPEEGLPRLPYDQAVAKFPLDQYDKDPETIRVWQNPANMHTLLRMDDAKGFLRLNYCTAENGENPALILLAEILLHHHGAQVIVNGEIKPLLNMEQQKKCLKWIRSLSTLTFTDKVLCHAFVDQANQVAGLKSELAELKAQNDKIDAKLDTLIKLLNPTEDILIKDEKEPSFKGKTRFNL